MELKAKEDKVSKTEDTGADESNKWNWKYKGTPRPLEMEILIQESNKWNWKLSRCGRARSRCPWLWRESNKWNWKLARRHPADETRACCPRNPINGIERPCSTAPQTLSASAFQESNKWNWKLTVMVACEALLTKLENPINGIESILPFLSLTIISTHPSNPINGIERLWTRLSMWNSGSGLPSESNKWNWKYR